MSYLAMLRSLEIEHPAAKFGNPALLPAAIPFKTTPLRILTNPWEERNSMLRSLAVPCEWKEGLLSMSGMCPPAGLTDDRWGQILDDADYVAQSWGRAAAQAGWTLPELFGCSPRFARRLDRDGVAVLLENRTITSVDQQGITIANKDGRLHTFRRKALLGAVPIWAAA
jgi:hypothetical protein